MTCVAHAIGRIATTYDLLVRTPDEAASLVAGGCGCEDEPRQGFAAFAVPDPDAPTSATRWAGVIGSEGVLTGDGRFIELNALRWENLPIPIRYAPVDVGGHDGAQVVGRILTVERLENGDIWATGDFDTGSEIGLEAARVVGDNITNGISMDLDDVSFEIRVAREILEEQEAMWEDGPAEAAEDNPTDDEGRVAVISINSDDEVMATTGARIRAATIVAIPAFANARIALAEGEPAADPEEPEDEANRGTNPDGDPCSCDEDADDYDPECDCADEAGDEEEEPALVASAFPLEPPAAWFDNPNLTEPTPITVTPDGRVFGHLAVWGTCHTAYSGQCVEPPHSPSDYAYFRTGAVLTAEGREVAVGRVTMDTMHAGRSLGATDTLAHYEHTGKGAADVAAGEDVFGIWIAGALRPGMSDERVRTLRSSPLSGDWRRIGAGLELVAALAVNSPGFPVPRPQGLVASGAMHSLVASGVLTPPAVEEKQIKESLSGQGFNAADVASLVVDEMEKREWTRRASALAVRTRRARAAVLAQRAGVR